MLFESWSHDALERAKLEGRPIFLTIGHAGSPLCNEMDQVFADKRVSDELGRFVCIRVDQEEFAEVASLYGDFAEALTGEPRDWPLNLILTPDQKPAVAVNFIEAESLASLLASEIPEVEVSFEHDAWGTQLPAIEIEPLLDQVDSLYGGLQGETRGPMGYLYSSVIQAFPDDPRAWFFAKRSLESIAKGAIRDPITGGIARLSEEEGWGKPSNEMRLCDNAHMAKAFLQLGFEELAAETCEYIVDELLSPNGGFYASASGLKRWSRKDMGVLGESTDLFCEFHSIPLTGDAYLRRGESVEEFAEKVGMEIGDVRRLLSVSYKKLAYPLQKNEQILPLWNGFAIDALMRVGTDLGIESFCAAAKRAFPTMKPRRFDEYASYIHAALALGEIDIAVETSKVVKHRFKADGGPFYMVDEKTPILVRRCELVDTTIPSGNSLHAENLLRLYELTDTIDYLEQAGDILKGAKDLIEIRPSQAGYYLIACQKHATLRA